MLYTCGQELYPLYISFQWLFPPPLILTAEQNCLELCELGVAPRLVGLLSASDKATRSHAILCLSAMATSGEGIVMKGVFWEGAYYLPSPLLQLLCGGCCIETTVFLLCLAY